MINVQSSLCPVLLVDDEEQFIRSAGIALRVAGFKIASSQKSSDVLAMMENHDFACVLLDIMMPGIGGLELLGEISKQYPSIPVIMVTAVNEVDIAVECMRLGAFDYLVKPVEKSRLISTVSRAVELVDMRNENKRLKEYLFKDKIENPHLFESIKTRNKVMYAIFQYIEAIAQTSMPVLITGETGTGKELIAATIHNASGRTGEFVSVNIAGLNSNLFCDELFGHEKGAFTGADKRREGLVTKAANGTLFLDEIGDLAPELQIKLLRLIENKTYYPVGSDSSSISTARIVVATNSNLDSSRNTGSFRNDLFFRLQSHSIHLPPLRERLEDISLLIDTFVEESAHQLNKTVPTIDNNVYEIFQRYLFPGNIRELKHLIFDAVSTDKTGYLTVETIKNRLFRDSDFIDGKADGSVQDVLKTDFSRQYILPSLKDAEEQLIQEALRRADGNQTIAAQLIGLTRSALNKRLTRSSSKQHE